MREFVILVLLAGVPLTALRGQTSITPRRTYERQDRAPASDPGESVSRFFQGSGAGFWPGSDSRLNLESKLYTIDVLGRGICDTAGKCTENIAFSLALDAYVVDAIGDQLPALKEYLVSKKGSPLSLRLPVQSLSFSTKRGTHRQSWISGELYGNGRLIPVSNLQDQLRLNGAISAGYTFDMALEFNINETTPGALFVEGTASLAGIIGNDLRDQLFADNSASKWVPGLDYRLGLQIGGVNPKSISIAGTRFLRPGSLRGNEQLLSLVFSQALTPPKTRE